MVESTSVDKYDVLEQIGMRQYSRQPKIEVELTPNRQRIFRRHPEGQEEIRWSSKETFKICTSLLTMLPDPLPERDQLPQHAGERERTAVL